MGVMRKRIKPIVVYVVLALLGLALVIANIHNTSKQQAHLQNVKSALPYATTPKTTTSSTSSSSDEELILNPIIDLSGIAMPLVRMGSTNLLKHILKNSKNVTFQLPSIPTLKVLLSRR